MLDAKIAPLYNRERRSDSWGLRPGYALSPLRGWAIVRQRNRPPSLSQRETIAQSRKEASLAGAERKQPQVQLAIRAQKAAFLAGHSECAYYFACRDGREVSKKPPWQPKLPGRGGH